MKFLTSFKHIESVSKSECFVISSSISEDTTENIKNINAYFRNSLTGESVLYYGHFTLLHFGHFKHKLVRLKLTERQTQKSTDRTTTTITVPTGIGSVRKVLYLVRNDCSGK